MTETLAAAQERRRDEILFAELDARLEIILSEADTVGPEARHKLRGILRHYAKMAHPFRACVRDNEKRFGPGQVEKVCAVLKDIIRGTTHWRNHPDESAVMASVFSDHGADIPVLNEDERREILIGLSDSDFDALEAVIYARS
jgi:hypothetical protein